MSLRTTSGHHISVRLWKGWSTSLFRSRDYEVDLVFQDRSVVVRLSKREWLKLNEWMDRIDEHARRAAEMDERCARCKKGRCASRKGRNN